MLVLPRLMRWTRTTAAILGAISLLVACSGGTTSTPAAQPAPAPAAQPVGQPAATLPEQTAKQACPANIALSSGGASGTGPVFVAAWAQIFQKAGLNASVEATNGSAQNVQKIAGGKADFGYTSLGPALDGWNGTGFAKGTKYLEQRAVFMMRPSYTQVFVLDKSPIKKFEDLAGKNVFIGQASSGSDEAGRAIFPALDMKVTLKNLEIPDGVDETLDGRFDATMITGGGGLAAYRDAETRAKLRWIDIPPALAEKVQAKVPWLSPVKMPKTYESQTGPIDTIGTWLLMEANSKISQGCVYQILKETYANWDKLETADSEAKTAKDPSVVLASPIPLHAGAVQYLTEKGIKVPDKLIPPEYKR